MGKWVINRGLQARFTEMQKPGFKNPHDLVQHFIENAGKDKHNTSKLIEGFVILNFAGVVSTGTVLTQALFDLAAHPEYIEPLREESRSLVASEGTIRLRPASLAKLQNMDSFFKESQRFNHANLRKTNQCKQHGSKANEDFSIRLPQDHQAAPSHKRHDAAG